VAKASLSADNVLCLSLQDPLPSGEIIPLTISGIEDNNGNQMVAATIDLIVKEMPEPGEILINELLYNPNTGNSADFVELINASEKFLSLDDVYLGRAYSSALFVKAPDGILLKPGEMVAFTDDVDEIRSTYEPPVSANIYQLNITNYVNGSGNVWIRGLLNGDQVTLDSLDYTDNFHSSLLSSTGKKGVSIERISIATDTNDESNWLSTAATNNYGTPGYANSQVSQGTSGDEMIALENKVFSPNMTTMVD